MVIWRARCLAGPVRRCRREIFNLACAWSSNVQKMSIRRDLRLASLLNSCSGAASGVVILTGCLVVIGWLIHFPGVRRIHPMLGTMGSYAAFCFIFSGVALALLRK